MKHKFNFWLQIVTICLCICAIAVGVYSATTASITASGKIAFTAHNCKVEVTGYIYGHAKGDVHDGLPVAEENKEPLTANNAPITVEGGVSTTTQSTISIGENRWFSDMASTDGKPANIVIGINVKNITIYDVIVAVNLDENSVTLPDDQVKITCDTESAVLKQGEDVTFEFTLELTPLTSGSTSAVYEEFGLNDLIIPFTSERYVEEPPADGELYVDSTTKRLYVNYGTFPNDSTKFGDNAGKPIRWVAIKDITNTNPTLTGLTDVPTAGKFYFVSEYAFDSQYFYDSEIVKDGKNLNDYETSDVRAYLLGETFKTMYGLTGLFSDTRVKARKLPVSETLTDLAEGVTVTTAINNCTDKIWLLSTDETTFVGDVMGTLRAYAPTIAVENIYNTEYTSSSEQGEFYLLRSPKLDDQYAVWVITWYGYVDYTSIASWGGSFPPQAIRPAFQLDLTA